MKIFLDDELLAVKEREDHRDGNCGCIVQGVEEGSRDKDLFFHDRTEKKDLY